MTEPAGEFEMVRSAVAIGRLIFDGDAASQKLSDKQLARRVYHLAATSNLPVYRLGAMLCARKSVLLKWIEDQEKRNSGGSAAWKAHRSSHNEETAA